MKTSQVSTNNPCNFPCANHSCMEIELTISQHSTKWQTKFKKNDGKK